MWKAITVILVLLVAGLVAYIRLAPSDPVEWNIDPMTAPVSANNGWLVKPEGGNAVSPVYAADAATILTAIDSIAMATPRTTRLAGSPDAGQITYVTRSRMMGFPDYTTVSTVAAENGTALVVYARQRFGNGDMGVNRARVESWLAALDLPAS